MSGWKPKRFWTEATAAPAEGGWAVLLDKRAAKTPGRLPLVLPTQALAQEVAAEWQAQVETIDPGTMPFTRMSNSAIEKVRPHHAEVAAVVAAYGGSDLLCYRAEAPDALIARQAAWDGPLDWAARRYGARLRPTAGVMPVPQPPQAVARLAQAVAALDPFRLAALHDLVALSGSLVLGLATAEGAVPAEEAWRLSRIDEDWQIEHWGQDAEAAAAAARKRDEFHFAKTYWDLCGTA